jgi:predicted ATPase/DNA-binding SARP family transcriptional activator
MAGPDGRRPGQGLEVALLGPLEVHLDGRRVTPTSTAQRVVLASLALAAGRAVSATSLIEALWIGEPPPNAMGNLQTYVSRLRRVIGAERLSHEPAGYRLHVGAEQLDTGRVERLVSEARALRADDPRRAASLLGEALELWRGDPLSDLTDPLAFAPAIARLSAWRGQLRQEWFELSLAAGQAVQVLPALQEALLADPLSEGLHLLSIRALHQSGRTVEALQVAEAFRRRLVEETGLDPSPAFVELQRRVLADDPELRPAPPSPPPRLAPPRRRAPGDRFVGRRPELDRLSAAIDEHRVVSVVGPGGVGKTRLVLELLDRLEAAAEERFLVELGEVSSAANTSSAVATALGLQAASEGIPAAIAGRLGTQPALLVLDNCEHVLPAVRELLAELLSRCPGLRVVATSRQRLGLADEQVLRLGPLTDDEQVELFVDRASLLRVDFEVSERTLAIVADICRAIDGLPLAVELAARREAVFGLVQLRERLTAGLEVLDPARDGDRSTAVTATVEWSYRLIDPDAQALFDRLAVCRGGFPLDALDHLAPPGLRSPASLLAELVEVSLVGVDLTSDAPRYRMLEMMRHVGLGHLSEAELDDAHTAHSEWILSVATTIDELQRRRSADAIRLFRQELVGIREALSWSIGAGRWERAARLAMLIAVPLADDPDLAVLAQLERLDPPVDQRTVIETETATRCTVAVGVAAWFCGDASRADELLTAALDRLPTDHPERWVVQLFFQWNRMFFGDVAAVEAHARELLSDPWAPPWARANAVCCTAMMYLFTGDPETAERWMADHDGLLADVSGSDGLVACTYGELTARDDPERALLWFEEAYRRCDAHGHTFNREVAAIGRVGALIRLGRHADAVVACRRLIATVWHMGMWPQTWTGIRLAAELLVAMDDPQPAAVLLAAGEDDRLAPVVLGAYVDRHAQLWSRIGEELGDADLAAARGSARVAGRNRAVGLALSALDRHA